MAKKGFGKSTEISIRDEVKFMCAVMQHIAGSRQNPAQVYPFFQSNLEKLNESLLEALPLVFTKLTANELPKTQQNIAELFMAFGNLIQQFSLGNRLLNLELGIAVYKSLLKIYTRRDFPQDWAMIQNNLGVAYRNRILGERATNLKQAIAAYNLALQVRTREDFPQDWAMTQNNLGAAYSERILGERATNLEQAIAAYNLALQIYTRKNFPKKWAGTQNNLGNAYRNRILGERATNLEQAIAAYNLALQVYTREDFPEKWATTQHNLANAYRDRIQGERLSNLEQAITIYEQASQVFTQETYPQRWAENQGHLAEALTKRALLASTFADEELKKAIALLKAALNVSVSGSPDFIDSQYRLGNALSHRYEHSKNPNDLEQALRAYKTALDLISPEHYDRKQIWQALPTTQSILGMRLVRDGQWQEGLQLLLNSVTQLSTGDDPLAHANALFQTGRAHETLSDWDNARLYYRDALRLYKHLQDQPGIAKSQVGLGGVLISQGHPEKGMSELAEAREIYQQLQQLSQVAEVDSLYQATQRAIERQAAEVFV
jgi:tetratricopeptide (TPR) repeat protein